MIAIVLAVALYALIGHMNTAPKWRKSTPLTVRPGGVVLADGSESSSIPGARRQSARPVRRKEERQVFLCGENMPARRQKSQT